MPKKLKTCWLKEVFNAKRKFANADYLLLQTFLLICKIFHFNGVLPHLYWKESFQVSALQEKRLSHFLSSAKEGTCNQQFRD